MYDQTPTLPNSAIVAIQLAVLRQKLSALRSRPPCDGSVRFQEEVCLAGIEACESVLAGAYDAEDAVANFEETAGRHGYLGRYLPPLV